MRNRKRTPRNPDRVTAAQVDPVAYMEISAHESLDDEIENFERFASNMPFGGEDQPIRSIHNRACAYGTCYCMD